ncbi:MAG: alpha/beta hydrolase [Muribaculaceae bacterium]|nr:alpha/beta hydrolase [Muribaculaceae bacterium]MDE6526800.1 alpha/beta hydrolase [Muribaculaceae bacterium]
MNTNTPTADWRPDILGDGFEMKYMRHPDDYCGAVRSTVIRHRCQQRTTKAILYVHGFSDYFLQKEMALMFTANGYVFYAVDLRRYGRSLLPGDRMFGVRDIHEYFADIDAAIAQMKTDGIERIALFGHSTGGLTTSLYMSETPSPLIKALILNSPFLDWNLPSWIKKTAIPAISALGALVPTLRIPQKADAAYAHSLTHWDYRREWKPDVLPDPDAGWIHAIQTAQKQLRTRRVDVPILLMHSARSARRSDSQAAHDSADAILDVVSMSHYGRRLGDDVTEVSFDGGLHDLALSAEPVRQRVYDTMLEWLADKGV